MQEIALVTMKDITKDRSMRYDEALDGQVNESNISLIIIPYMIFYEISILDLLKKMLYRYGDLLPKSKPDFSQ